MKLGVILGIEVNRVHDDLSGWLTLGVVLHQHLLHQPVPIGSIIENGRVVVPELGASHFLRVLCLGFVKVQTQARIGRNRVETVHSRTTIFDARRVQ